MWLLTTLTAASSWAATGQEQQWIGAIQQSPAAPAIVWLGEAEQRFLALYKQDTTGAPKGGVILLHSIGTHPDWPMVIHPLREALPDYGWDTLAIQLPIPDSRYASIKDYPALYDRSVQRILLAIKYLRDHDIHNIALVGYDLGATLAAAYLANNDNPQVVAYVGINMASYPLADPHFDAVHSLEQIRLPILDVFGTLGPTSVVSKASLRALAARRSGSRITREQKLEAYARSAIAESNRTRQAGFIAYRQFAIPAADASFHGFESHLSKRVAGWLDRHASGTRIDKGVFNTLSANTQ
ncbi:MAG: DUF3530 family protein [Gammaproteobacteria bacterium]|nr:DUF3530 family protein [Gammaproteobacteria bacterium]